ncbi:MAG TPA: family 43 glycosylhydrolase, partial [Candidatus Xenobia bacterium]
GHPTAVLHGTEPWEDKDGNPYNGTLRYTNEGPTALKRDGRYYVMYSGGSWDLPTYSLAAASAPAVRGPYRKQAPVILHSTRFVEGPGHNCLVAAPNNVDDECLYHARVYPFLDPWNRQLFVDRLFWQEDRKAMAPPSLGFRPPPDRPAFEDRFDTEGSLSSAWTVVSGSFSVAGGFARGSGRCEGGPALRGAVCEVNVRPRQAVAGLSLGRFSVLLDHDALRCGATRVHLPGGFRTDVWHQLLVCRNQGRVDVFLDGTHVTASDIDTQPARLALVAEGQADFGGVAVTAAWRGDSGWKTISGVWHANGRLQGTGMASKGEPALAHEFSTTLQWLGGSSSEARVGAGVRSDQHTVAGTFDRTIWPFAKFYVLLDGRVIATAQLPRGFQYDEPHTLRVCQSATGVDFTLDGQPAASVDVAVGPSVPCVVAMGAQAAFSHCEAHHVETSPNLLHNAGFETEQWQDSGAALPGNPWQTEGSARSAYSGLSGVRRLVILAPGGTARQMLQGLSAGHHVLRGMVELHGTTHAQVSVAGQATPLSGAPDTWVPFEIPFHAEGDTVVMLSAAPEAGASASFDDLYLSHE